MQVGVLTRQNVCSPLTVGGKTPELFYRVKPTSFPQTIGDASSHDPTSSLFPDSSHTGLGPFLLPVPPLPIPPSYILLHDINRTDPSSYKITGCGTRESRVPKSKLHPCPCALGPQTSQISGAPITAFKGYPISLLSFWLYRVTGDPLHSGGCRHQCSRAGQEGFGETLSRVWPLPSAEGAQEEGGGGKEEEGGVESAGGRSRRIDLSPSCGTSPALPTDAWRPVLP